MVPSHVFGSTTALRGYELFRRHRVLISISLILGLLAGLGGMATMRMDMSFRPTFTNNHVQLDRTAAAEHSFGIAGYNELVVIVDVGNASDPSRLLAVHDLAEQARALPHFHSVREPLNFPYADRTGTFHPDGALGLLQGADDSTRKEVVGILLATPSVRRLAIGDGNRRVAVTVALDIANQDFSSWRDADHRLHNLVSTWQSRQRSSGINAPVQITGYPDVEQVYAHEVFVSVLRSVAVLIAVMIVILFLYFRRLADIVICLIGVTFTVPLTLGAMKLLGQPFSIVNSQLLTLVLIVGIAEALQQHQEYIRRREAGGKHSDSNREAFGLLAWAAFTTGMATVLGFGALYVADMKAISSFGLCAAVGVAIAYLVNWLVVPIAIDVFYRRSDNRQFEGHDNRWTVAMLRGCGHLATRRPVAVVLISIVIAVAFGGWGLSRLSIDQKVNQELPTTHTAFVAQQTFEREFTGFLGPEVWVRFGSGTVSDHAAELTRVVSELCAQPEVRYVASPLDLVPQPALAPGEAVRCTRQAGDLSPALAARNGSLGPVTAGLAQSLMTADGKEAAIIVRVPDIGTKAAIPLSHRIEDTVRRDVPGGSVDLVGPWWLAQQGMHELSFEMGISAITALALILPIMWLAIRDWRLLCAAVVPTVLPILAVVGFMGLTGITVRIGTAMMLAIALGLAASNTIHICLRIRDRVRAGMDPGSAVRAVLSRTGKPVAFGSYVLVGGFVSMLASSLLALQDMGMVGSFTMLFSMVADLLVGPAVYVVLSRIGRTAQPPQNTGSDSATGEMITATATSLT